MRNLETSRDFACVEDTVRAMVDAIEVEKIEGEIINLGMCETQRMKDVLAVIKREAQAEDKEVVLDKSRLRPKDVDVLSQIMPRLGNSKWVPSITLEEVIGRTTKWHIDNCELWSYEKPRWPW